MTNFLLMAIGLVYLSQYFSRSWVFWLAVIAFACYAGLNVW